MAGNFTPLIEVLHELKTAMLKKASGFFFIVTEENHSCIFRLQGGHVEDVIFRMLRNDEAVQRLAMASGARARFQADPALGAGANGKSVLGETTLQWLLGGFETDPALRPRPQQPPATPPAPVAAVPSNTGPALGPRQREAIQQVSLHYFGPIASMLCEEAFEDSGDLQQILGKLATNLASPEEVQRFLSEATAAVANAGR